MRAAWLRLQEGFAAQLGGGAADTPQLLLLQGLPQQQGHPAGGDPLPRAAHIQRPDMRKALSPWPRHRTALVGSLQSRTPGRVTEALWGPHCSLTSPSAQFLPLPFINVDP